MCRILIVENEKIERNVTREILFLSFDCIDDVFEACNNDDALEILKDEEIDIIILNLPNSFVSVKHLVTQVKQKNSTTAIILTSVKSEREVSHAMVKLKAEGYLLKPYSSIALASAIAPYIKKTEPQKESPQLDGKSYIDKFRECMQQNLYKKSLEISKEYIDFVYKDSDNINKISIKVLEFIKEIAYISGDYNQNTMNSLIVKTEKLKGESDKFSRKYYSYSLIGETIDTVFEEIDKSRIYSDDIKKILNYIDRNIKKGVTLEEVADNFNMSYCYFSKFFKKAVKVNFITYITDRRIEYAKEMLLNTDMPIINIAYDLSFNETNYFSKAFKKKVGVTPTEYREKYAVLERTKAV